MSYPIRCKVAAIVSDRELVINAGSVQGVEPGMVFDVKGSLDVVDPDSEELLETIEVTKVSVKVSRVTDKVAVARTFKNVGPGVGPLELAFLARPQRERITTDPITAGRSWDNTVRVGDEAILAL